MRIRLHVRGQYVCTKKYVFSYAISISQPCQSLCVIYIYMYALSLALSQYARACRPILLSLARSFALSRGVPANLIAPTRFWPEACSLCQREHASMQMRPARPASSRYLHTLVAYSAQTPRYLHALVAYSAQTPLARGALTLSMQLAHSEDTSV